MNCVPKLGRFQCRANGLGRIVMRGLGSVGKGATREESGGPSKASALFAGERL